MPIRIESVGDQMLQVRSPRFELTTNLKDAERIAGMMQVLEASRDAAIELAPQADPPIVSKGYFFQSRDDWQEFSIRQLGNDARPYLLIPSGAYVYGNWFAGYDVGPTNSLRVLSHESWHQFSASFRQALPPALEEGIACTFETVRRRDGAIWIDRASNALRQNQLEQAAQFGRLLTLSQLLQMQAGQAVRRERVERDGFYAQAWALALYLEAIGAMKPMLTDAVAGTIDPLLLERPVELLAHYADLTVIELETGYTAYVLKWTAAK